MITGTFHAIQSFLAGICPDYAHGTNEKMKMTMLCRRPGGGLALRSGG
jgi:hypothetical protein